MFRINETFYSLQGEGYYTGTPAFFIRFSGCNLNCPFCDTNHKEGNIRSVESLVEEARACTARLVVLTGGEPSLFITNELICKLHEIGKFIAVETNGTRPIPWNVDWITCSPKNYSGISTQVCLTVCNELKILYTGQSYVEEYPTIKTNHYFLQPMDTGDKEENARLLKGAMAYCLFHPKWRLSLQTHKLLKIK